MRDNLKKVLGVLLLLLLGLAGITVFFQQRSPDDIQQQVAETRRRLRAEGFKTDLADFDFTTDASLRARAAMLASLGGTVRPVRPTGLDRIDLLPIVPDGSAVVIWQEDWLQGESSTVTWTDLHDDLDANGPALDAACAAILSGPIQFELEASRGRAMLLRHLAPMRGLEQALDSRTLLELHDHHPEAAWTNLLALTRLVTAWHVEPAEISHLVQSVLVNSAFQATWQALQAGNWSDAQLAGLQQEWATPDFFTNLPEIVAFQRASDVGLCQQERVSPLGGMPLSAVVKRSLASPRAAIAAIKQYRDAARYRAYGTYDDEKNLLLFYRQRELDQRHALTAATWKQMRALPNVTNTPPFVSPHHSRMSMMSLSGMRRMNEDPLFARAAAAEVRRRLILTALALERYHQQNQAYPPTLAALVPEFLPTPPVDFMDGQPLRYIPGNDGHFTLYSVGLDLVDNGGAPPPPPPAPSGSPSSPLSPPFTGTRRSRTLAGTGSDDRLCWPRPAGAAAVDQLRQTAINTALLQAAEELEREATRLWMHTDKRQGLVEKLLATPMPTNGVEATDGGRPLSETLRTGTNQLSAIEMLTLRQVITGGEPETVAFELPIAYDAATAHGHLELMIDPDYQTDDEEGSDAQLCECTRAPDGNCRLVWQTIYESPGRHALQAAFFQNGSKLDTPDLRGPLLPFTLTNLCQFTPGSAHFQTGIGANWRARLPEANARYVMELNTTNGSRLKTLTGSTTNGEFQGCWNLVDDQGQRFTGEEFNSVLHLTFPDSGRTQTLRGP